MPGGVLLPYDDRQIQRLVANVAQSQTDSVLLAAVAGKRIIVLDGHAEASAATDLTFNTKGSGAGTPISPLYPLGAKDAFPLGLEPAGHYRTIIGQALTCTTGAGGTTAINLTVAVVGAGDLINSSGQSAVLQENGDPLLQEDGLHYVYQEG